MSGWTQHLSDDRLIDRLYGVERTGDAQHLESCSDCAIRWEALRERRGQLSGEVPESAAPWAEQRCQILERIEGGGAAWNWQRAWAPALLTAAVLAGGVYFFRPAPLPQPDAAAVSVDTTVPGWFEETYSVMQPDEPRAASAIRVLFEQPEERVTEKVTE